jgi:hypothetical protein
MTLPTSTRYWLGLLGIVAVISDTGQILAQQDIVEEIRTQKVGEVNYFYVRLRSPDDMMDFGERLMLNRLFVTVNLSWRPKLVADGGGLGVVCLRVENPDARRDRPRFEPFQDAAPNAKSNDAPKEKGVARQRDPVPIQGLEFLGRYEANVPVRAKLCYPIRSGKEDRNRFLATPPSGWKEATLVLDFGSVKPTPVPPEAAERKSLDAPLDELHRYGPVRDDLEGLWAAAQIDQFVGLSLDVREFGFYQFAATAAARKYRVDTDLGRRLRRFSGDLGRTRDEPDGDGLPQLYELTTGSAAITESLQLRRMNPVRGNGDDVRRDIVLSTLKGIEIQEHPWKKMMGEKTPAPEPMAKFVPHDNYYVHFNGLPPLLDLGELTDRWGTNLLGAYQVQSRDYRVQQRYEDQLCLKSAGLAKTLGPLVVNGVAITGNDPFLREGTDVAVLFAVKNRTLFLAGVEPCLAEAKKRHGGDLKVEKGTYKDVAVERFTTPLREVSLHRATIGDVVIYANSSVGLERIIDAHRGDRPALINSLDFQYMRTVFRRDDESEDGFVFLSDAFIRHLVSPATKIKERRRLEALASLQMLTHAALFAGWDAGKPAESLEGLLSLSTLKPNEVPMPEGKPATWNPFKMVGHSEIYNTIHFATPLIEIPIGNVTLREADEYERFRLEYLGLWREFFDPIGVRMSVKPERINVQTYILPLIENSAYNRLRRVTGGGVTPIAPAAIPTKTLVQYLQHINSDSLLRDVSAQLGFFGDVVAPILNPLGKWVFVRLDDDESVARFAQALEKADRGEFDDSDELFRQGWKLPIVLGADVRNTLTMTAALTSLRASALKSLPGGLTWEPMDKEYRGISIVRVEATIAGRNRILGRTKDENPYMPAIYYALIDGGFYLTLNEPTMKSLIDTLAAQKNGKSTKVDVNSSLYVSPAAAVSTQGLIQFLLERQTQKQTFASTPIWYALYRSQVVKAGDDAVQSKETAFRILGFVPISPEGAAFRFDSASDEVINERHGSPRRPNPPLKLADRSPLARLIRDLRSARADLRFREDGIHTVVTIERQSRTP